MTQEARWTRGQPRPPSLAGGSMGCQERRKSSAAYAPVRSGGRVQKREEQQTIKVDERKLKSGIVVEYFCTVGGPTVEQCMEQVMQIAADALARKLA